MADQPALRPPDAGRRRRTDHRPITALVAGAMLVVGLGLGTGSASASTARTVGDRTGTEPLLVPVEIEPVGFRPPVEPARPDPGYSGAVGATGLATAVLAAAATAVSARRRT